jgi:peptidyl-prolyl cis-trans isomerase B (cyclophilin B)
MGGARRRLIVSTVAVTALVSGCTGGNPSEPPPTHDPQPVNPEGAACRYRPSPADLAAGGSVEPPASRAAYEGRVEVTLQTNRGDIGAELDATSAPCAVNSFTALASQAFYDGTQCFLLLTGGGINALQCGDPTGTGAGGPGYTFADELEGNETYPAGTLAMANGGPDDNGSQFFIVYEDSDLPALYTVFGRIDADGLDVVREVADAGSDDSQETGRGRPDEPLVIDFLEIGG